MEKQRIPKEIPIWTAKGRIEEDQEGVREKA